MKNLKQIIAQIQPLTAGEPTAQLNELIWQLICYPPKMPLRLHQEQLLSEAETQPLQVYDEYFTAGNLTFNTFKWGNGKRRIMLTHGWGSKAADFAEIITNLRQLPDVQVIAFDAPGNGSSEGELSNLLLFVAAITATIKQYGQPDVLIGHSIGAMANVVVLQQINYLPPLLVSLTPLIKLKENFEASMAAVGLSAKAQTIFLHDFESRYNRQASAFNMTDLYPFNARLNHWLVYDELDKVSPYPYMAAFLALHPEIDTLACNGAGHDRVLKSPEMLAGLLNALKAVW